VLEQTPTSATTALIVRVDEAEMDEMRSFVQSKRPQRWLQQFYTDRWGAYLRLLQPEQHTVGQTNTQRIERKHLTLRIRIKRLARNHLLL
jgi:insertion element IS1 protein InsB